MYKYDVYILYNIIKYSIMHRTQIYFEESLFSDIKQQAQRSKSAITNRAEPFTYHTQDFRFIPDLSLL